MVDAELDIYLAMVDAINLAVDGTIDVQFPMETFEKPNSKKYLEFIQIRNNQSNTFWGDEKVYQGTMRLLLHWPINEEGPRPALEFIRALALKFPKSSILRKGIANVMLTDNPSLSSAITEPSEVILPLSIPYRHIQLA